ncbi:DUF1203 domain-containing protein [Streptomyces sp. CRN 30]|uniref:DUF1203 domain-containing protein n=1 Tax=Streptomyces sp. CRN 30 TaxID=3075613 RepID=UPI002A7FD44F|nr:DUF1203 domain-containing protein [Streptomyces sp. CRN 30]
MDTPTYRPAAVPRDVLAGLRARDDAGAVPRPWPRDEDGLPLRCCLRRSRAGERIALVSYAPLRRWAARTGATPGAYDEVGPVFVHLGPCAGPDPGAGHPFTGTGAARVVRRYTAGGAIAGGELLALPRDSDAARAALADAVEKAFADPETALVQVRAVEHGCFLYEVSRP